MRPRAAPALLLALALAGTACAPEAPGDVLLVMVDTLRADRVGLLGADRAQTPHLDRFFAGGAVYERAYATAAATSPSAVSLLTGLPPREHGVRLLYQLVPEDVALVGQLLPEAWQTAAFVSSAVMTDPALGIAGRFDHYDDFVDEREAFRENYERSAERTTAAALRWLEGEADPARPLLLFVHYIDPHGPYLPPEPFRRRFDHEGRVPVEPGRVPGYQRQPGLGDALDYVDRYDGEVAYVDAAFEALVAGFAERRALDRALVVLTADHGETLLEPGRRRWFAHDWQVYEELIRVPLLLRGADVAAGRSDAPVSLTDVVPTILRHAGVATPAGVDLRRPGAVPRDRIVTAESTRSDGQWLAALRGDAKAMVAVREDRRITERRRYGLSEDPAEAGPAAPRADDPLLSHLESAVRTDPAPAGIPPSLRRGMRPTSPRVHPRLPPDAEPHLRALGYLD